MVSGGGGGESLAAGGCAAGAPWSGGGAAGLMLKQPLRFAASATAAATAGAAEGEPAVERTEFTAERPAPGGRWAGGCPTSAPVA
jgi:hypothetical protein